MSSLVSLQVWGFGVDLLTVWKATLVYSPLLITDWASVQSKICVWQGGAFQGWGRGGGGEGDKSRNHLPAPRCDPNNGWSGAIGASYSDQASREGFHCCASWNVKSYDFHKNDDDFWFDVHNTILKMLSHLKIWHWPDSGEEGGVRGWPGGGLASDIFTVSWLSPRAPAGWAGSWLPGPGWLLFSTLRPGEKGGVSPSREWMLELEDELDRWPGERYEASLELHRPRSQMLRSSRLNLSSSVSSRSEGSDLMSSSCLMAKSSSNSDLIQLLSKSRTWSTSRSTGSGLICGSASLRYLSIS